MGEIILADREQLPCPPEQAFDVIAGGGLPGWRLPRGQALRLGVPVAIPLTLPATLGGQRAEILGRVVSVDRPRRFVVHHDLPWTGSVTVSVRPDGPARSTVRVAVQLDEEALGWARRMVAAPAPAAGDVWRLGLISSGTGPASVFSVAARSTARLAVEQINADGGVLGRPLELMTGDDGTHPGLGAAELVRLAHAGCRVVLANVTSAVFQALRPVARKYGVLIIHTPLNEGGAGAPELLRLGERPAAQAAAAIPALMRATSGSHFYLAGNDYCWSRGANRAVRRVVERSGGSVAAEAYAELGTTDFASLIASIRRSGADLVVSSLVGADEVAFEQQMHAAGLRQEVATLALVLDESTHEFIGPDASEGLWTAFSYFESLDSAANNAFKADYHRRFGPEAAPVSSMTEGLYEAVHLVTRAAADGGSWDPVVVGERLRVGVTYDGPRGRVSTSWRGLHQPIYLATSRGGALRVTEQLTHLAR